MRCPQTLLDYCFGQTCFSVLLSAVSFTVDWQVLELCAGFCEIADLRAIICRLITESSADTPLLTSIANWAILSPTELTVAVECLQHFYEVSVDLQT